MSHSDQQMALTLCAWFRCKSEPSHTLHGKCKTKKTLSAVEAISLAWGFNGSKGIKANTFLLILTFMDNMPSRGLWITVNLYEYLSSFSFSRGERDVPSIGHLVSIREGKRENVQTYLRELVTLWSTTDHTLLRVQKVWDIQKSISVFSRVRVRALTIQTPDTTLRSFSLT